jgi:hypothetical protein
MKRFILSTALILGFFALTRGEAPKKAEKKPAAKPVVVPFEILKSGHMAVMVKVNGKGPFKLIFDTGAPVTLVGNKLAEEAGLLKGVIPPLIPLFGMKGEVKIKSLEVGKQKAVNMSAIVMDHPAIEIMSKKLGPLHGIVGFPFFAQFKTTLDYETKTLTFSPGTFKPQDVMKGVANLMLAGLAGPRKKVLAPAAQWGFEVTKEEGDEDAGVTVGKVIANSPVAIGGLKKGDRLLTLDGRWTDSPVDVFEAASTIKAGTTAVLRVRRGKMDVVVKVKPSAGL